MYTGRLIFLSSYGLLAKAYLQAMCKPLPWKPKNQKFHMSRPVPMHGICATYIQRKPARYRSLPKGTAQQALPYGHLGGIARNTLANANKNGDWRIYADLAQSLITTARGLYTNEDLGLELDNTVYALDASTIDLCLSVFPWASFRRTKAAVKSHTLLDLRGIIPTFIHITDGKVHDVNVLDILIPEPGAFYIMDRGYVDFKRLYTMHNTGAS